MPTEEQIRKSLEGVLVPGVMRSLVKLNLVRQVSITDERIHISIASAALNPMAQNLIEAKVDGVTKRLPGVKETTIDFIEASPKEINASAMWSP